MRLFLQRHDSIKIKLGKPMSLRTLISVVYVRGRYASKAAASLKSPPCMGASSGKVALLEICLTYRQLDRWGECPFHNPMGGRAFSLSSCLLLP